MNTHTLPMRKPCEYGRMQKKVHCMSEKSHALQTVKILLKVDKTASYLAW